MLATIAAMGLRYVGVTGNDDNGERIRRELTLLGLDITDVIVRDVPNPHAVILVDEVSVSVWCCGTATTTRMRPANPVAPVSQRAVVHVDDTDQAASIAVAAAARDAGVLVTSDIDRPDRSDRGADCRGQAADLRRARSGRADRSAGMAGAAPDAGATRPAVRHLGPRGSMLLVGDTLYAEGRPVKAIDTTGAGDVFRGGFVYAWLKGDHRRRSAVRQRRRGDQLHARRRHHRRPRTGGRGATDRDRAAHLESAAVS